MPFATIGGIFASLVWALLAHRESQAALGSIEVVVIAWLTIGSIAGVIGCASGLLSAPAEECTNELDSITLIWRQILLPFIERT